MNLTDTQKSALAQAINIIDAIGYGRVNTLEELKERFAGVDFIEVADNVFDVIASDESWNDEEEEQA